MAKPTIDKGRFEFFMRVYARQLAVAVAKYPESYGYPVTEVPTVTHKMRQAIEAGSFNHDGAAFRLTCQDIGIKHTRTAILNYIGGEHGEGLLPLGAKSTPAPEVPRPSEPDAEFDDSITSNRDGSATATAAFTIDDLKDED